MKPLELARRRFPPDFSLQSDSGNPISPESYRRRQQSLFLVILHGPSCPDCAALVNGIALIREEVESWDCDILLIRSEETPFSSDLVQAADSAECVNGVYAPGSSAAIACIDFRGRFMEGWSLSHPEHADWREVTETVRWMAIQEPECGTCIIAEGWGELAGRGNWQ